MGVSVVAILVGAAVAEGSDSVWRLFGCKQLALCSAWAVLWVPRARGPLLLLVTLSLPLCRLQASLPWLGQALQPTPDALAASGLDGMAYRGPG